MSSDLTTLTKLIVRQSTLINLISAQLAEQACLLEQTLTRCSCEDCEEPATVEHHLMDTKVCDRHAATIIVKSKRAYVDSCIADPEDPLNTMKLSLMNENNWTDLQNADKIRKLLNYVKIINELDAPAHGEH